MNDDIIKAIKDSSYFTEFQEYLEGKINELNSLTGIEGLSNELAGEEVKARLKARNKLIEILSSFINTREKKEPTTQEIHNAKQRYGI